MTHLYKTLTMIEQCHSLMLMFSRAKGNIMLKSMNGCIKRLVPNNVNTWITYTGNKLNARFQIKDKTAEFINMI